MFDFQFSVYDNATNGNQITLLITNAPVGVTNGLFTTSLDFSNGIFTGPDRWLNIGVRTNGGIGIAYTYLLPRQKLTPVPYAIFAGGASNLLGAIQSSQLAGTVSAAQISGTYTGAVSFSSVSNAFAGAFTGNGAGIYNAPYVPVSRFVNCYGFGDSVAAGAGATTYSNNWFSRFCQTNQFSSAQNLAVGGGEIADYWAELMPGFVYTNYSGSSNLVATAPATISAGQVFVGGMGDYNLQRDFGTNPAALAYHRAGYESLGVYLSTPLKMYASNAVPVGGWNYWPWYGGGLQTTNSTNSITFTNIIGDHIYVAYMSSTSNDMAGITIIVNGVNYGLYSPVTSLGNRVNRGGAVSPAPAYNWISSTNLWMTPYVARISLPGMSVNTVKVMATGAGPGTNSTVLWVAGNGQSFMPNANPVVIFADQITQSNYTGNSGSLLGCSLYNAALYSVVMELESDGLPVYYAPTCAGFNNTTMLSSDGVHPSDSGHGEIDNAVQYALNQAQFSDLPVSDKAAYGLEGFQIGNNTASTGSLRLSLYDSITWPHPITNTVPGIVVGEIPGTGNGQAMLDFFIYNGNGTSGRHVMQMQNGFPFLAKYYGVIGGAGTSEGTYAGFNGSSGISILSQYFVTNSTTGSASYAGVQFGQTNNGASTGFNWAWHNVYGTPSGYVTNAALTATGQLIQGTNTVAPAPVSWGGTFWNSNNALYWITTSHTNYITGP